jgi:choloylglycine hydrolase
MYKKMFIMLFTLAAAAVLMKGETRACTDFRLIAKDGAVVIGRTMEFPVDIKSVIWVVPRGIQNTSVNDKGMTGLTWKSRYGFIGIDGFELHSSYVEGMNEKGLSFEGLMCTGAQYQTAVPGKFVTNADLCAWIMGNFATVDEVKKAIPTVNIADMVKKEFHGSLGLHIAVNDAGGNGIVIEFVGGRVKVYDNKLGVMTNKPGFEWHMNSHLTAAQERAVHYRYDRQHEIKIM